MRVLVLSNFGMGLYKFRKEILETLVQDNHEVIASFPEDEFVKPIIELGCQFKHIDLDRRGMNPLKDLKLIFNYIKLIKRVKPDIVLTYTIKPNIYAGILSLIFDYKYFPNITGAGNSIENGGVLSILTTNLYKYALKNAEKVFFQNQYNLNYFQQKKLINKMQPILLPGSGVNTDNFSYQKYPSADKDIRILYIGRILKDKGINELLEAIKYIKPRYPSLHFDIIGFCDEKYEEILQEFDEKGLLKFHGQQNNVVPFIENCHAIIQPSYHEGMSNVLLESASSGRPILASNVPGCQETFDEGISGIGFEAKNTQSLIESLERFIQLPYELKVEMGQQGRRKIIREFNREIIIKSYRDEINKFTEE